MHVRALDLSLLLVILLLVPRFSIHIEMFERQQLFHSAVLEAMSVNSAVVASHVRNDNTACLDVMSVLSAVAASHGRHCIHATEL